MHDDDCIIHVVEDDASFRTSLVRLLKAGGYTVRSYESVGEVLLELPPLTPGCFLLDVCLPGPDGLAFQHQLQRWPEPLPIIFMSGQVAVPTIVQAMAGGAIDFLPKPLDAKALFNAVDRALERDQLDREARRQAREFRRCYDSLTPREREVLVLVVSGYHNREIAGQLRIAERTVKAHRAQVMDKMHAHDLPTLVRKADQLSVLLAA